MLRNSQPLTIAPWSFVVWEANWDMSGLPQRLADEAHKLRESLEPDTDLDLLSFRENIYPWLAGYSTGNVPSAEEAFYLPDEELDAWYCAVRNTNPDLFPEIVSGPNDVSFRDGSSLKIVSARLPSSLRRLFIQDNVAHRYLANHPEDYHEFARLKVFAKLVCCSHGDVPSYEDMKDWPATELEKWYAVVLYTNPHLFLTPDEEKVSQTLSEKEEADLESKKNSPQPSSSSSPASSKRKAKTSRQLLT